MRKSCSNQIYIQQEGNARRIAVMVESNIPTSAIFGLNRQLLTPVEPSRPDVSGFHCKTGNAFASDRLASDADLQILR